MMQTGSMGGANGISIQQKQGSAGRNEREICIGFRSPCLRASICLALGTGTCSSAGALQPHHMSRLACPPALGGLQRSGLRQSYHGLGCYELPCPYPIAASRKVATAVRGKPRLYSAGADRRMLSSRLATTAHRLAAGNISFQARLAMRWP